MTWSIIHVLQQQDVISGKGPSQRSHFTSVKGKLLMPLGESEVAFFFLLIKCEQSECKTN